MSATASRQRPLRLAVLLTHPVQYFKPVFQELAAQKDLELLVLFGCDHGLNASLDPDFGVAFAWDSTPAEGFPRQVLSERPLAQLSSWTSALPLAWRAAKRLSRFRPDAVLVFAYTPAFITLTTLLLTLRGERLLLRADGTDRAFSRSPLKAALKDGVLRLWYRQFRHIFPIGSDSNDHFQRLAVPAARRTPVRYAVDVDYFADQLASWRPRRPSLRRELGIPEQARVLLWCGKITAVKNPQLLLQALQHLQPGEREHLWLVVVGDGELRSDFERGVAPLLPERSRFLGFLNQSQLGRAYALADALVFPSSQGETWGLVVNEALQFGLAVLASDHAGCARDLLAVPAALPPGTAVFSSGDAAALAAAMRGWLTCGRDPADPARPPAPPLPHPRDLAEAVASVVRRLGPRGDGASRLRERCRANLQRPADSHSASTSQRQ